MGTLALGPGVSDPDTSKPVSCVRTNRRTDESEWPEDQPATNTKEDLATTIATPSFRA